MSKLKSEKVKNEKVNQCESELASEIYDQLTTLADSENLETECVTVETERAQDLLSDNVEKSPKNLKNINIQKYLIQTELEEVKYWINHNLVNYLNKPENVENVSEIEHIVDYFNANNFPRLRKMSYSEAKNGAEKWVKSLVKKGNDIDEGVTDLEIVLDFKDGFKLVRLIGENAFKREGALMSHCVGSYVGRQNTAIYSLRDSRNMPHCTIEVQGQNNINQIKGKGNGSIHPNYVSYIVKVLEFFKISVRDSEMRNLGYVNLESVTPGLHNYVKDLCAGMKSVEINGVNYTYEDSIRV